MDYTQFFALPEPANRDDCYAFSLHKAGSSLLFGMIWDLCNREAIPSLNIPDILFENGIFEESWNGDAALLSFIRKGYLYYGFRLFPEFLDGYSAFERRKVVLLVRDPRDALVSQYYSFGGKHFSHILPERNAEILLGKARQTESFDIDKYVVQSAVDYRDKLKAYLERINSDTWMLIRYEDFYFDKLTWLTNVLRHFGIEISPEVVESIARRHDIRPGEEDPTKHIRKGTPGDHREKLQPETIQRLNGIFADVASPFGYTLS